jgi:3-oxoacyl-[acyl-carrier-protein] synthase II
MGLGWGPLWNGLCEGKVALGLGTNLDAAGFRSRLVGEVPEFRAQDFVPKSYRKAVKVMARDIELAVAAAKLAVEDAGLVTRGMLEAAPDATQTYPSERMGCHIGAGLIAAETDEMCAAMATARSAPGSIELDMHKWGGSSQEGAAGTGMEQLTPLWLLKYLPNMLACHVTIVHGCEGPSNTITCAEASGLLCVGESTRVIERGAADLCFSGGLESKLNPMGMLRLDLAGFTAPTEAETDASRFARAYDPEARGCLLGEGGGVIILENEATARARGAKIYAEVAGVGGGASDRAYAQGEDDEGMYNAVQNALDDAGIGADRIDAIVPLGSGIPALDRAEFGAMKRTFGDRLKDIPLVLVTPNVGMCVAGAGALQVAAGAGCLHQQKLPARVQAGRPRAGVQAGPAGVRSAALDYVLAFTGSLGGQNAAVVLKRHKP